MYVCLQACLFILYDVLSYLVSGDIVGHVYICNRTKLWSEFMPIAEVYCH